MISGMSGRRENSKVLSMGRRVECFGCPFCTPRISRCIMKELVGSGLFWILWNQAIADILVRMVGAAKFCWNKWAAYKATWWGEEGKKEGWLREMRRLEKSFQVR